MLTNMLEGTVDGRKRRRKKIETKDDVETVEVIKEPKIWSETNEFEDGSGVRGLSIVRTL